MRIAYSTLISFVICFKLGCEAIAWTCCLNPDCSELRPWSVTGYCSFDSCFAEIGSLAGSARRPCSSWSSVLWGSALAAYYCCQLCLWNSQATVVCLHYCSFVDWRSGSRDDGASRATTFAQYSYLSFEAEYCPYWSIGSDCAATVRSC